MKKVIGYVLVILGLVGIAAWSIPDVKAAIPGLDQFGDMTLVIASVVLAVLGLWVVSRGGGYGGGSQKGAEVPIYRGKRIVGYRRA